MKLTRLEVAEWIASLLNEECNHMQGRVNHQQCLKLVNGCTGHNILNWLEVPDGEVDEQG